MAVRTAAAADLDTKIAALLTSLDTFLGLAKQSGEPQNAVGDIFWHALISQLVTRSRMNPIILNNPRGIHPYAIAGAAVAHTVTSLDPNA